MDLPVVGAHCALASCHELDFLPIRCRCDKFYCRHHISPETHHCVVEPSTPVVNATFEKLVRCALDGCNKPSLESFVAGSGTTAGRSPAVCSACNLSFCASHRHAASHSCHPQELPTEPKNEAARALLHKHFPSSSTTKMEPKPLRSPKVPSDPKKLAQMQKLELMKMRHRAAPGDPRDKSASLGMDQRLHLRVSLGEIDDGKVFWFRKSIGIGKAIDCLANHLGIGSSQDYVVHLCKVTSAQELDETFLPMDRELCSQVDDGQRLVLVRSRRVS